MRGSGTREGACHERRSAGLEGAVPALAALLWTLPSERTEVGFDQLRELCLSAIMAARPTAPGEPARVLAAIVVYRSLGAGGE